MNFTFVSDQLQLQLQRYCYSKVLLMHRLRDLLLPLTPLINYKNYITTKGKTWYKKRWQKHSQQNLIETL